MGILTRTTEFLNTVLNNIEVNTALNKITNLITTTLTFDDGSSMDTAISVESLNAGVIVKPTYVYNTGLGTVTIGAGTYHTYTTTDYTGKIVEFELTEDTLTLADNTTSYIIASYNSGTPQYNITTDISSVDDAINCVIYTVHRNGDTFSIIDWDNPGLGLSNKTHRRLIETHRFERVYGFDISEYGTRNLLVSAGKVWQGAYPNSLDEANSVDNTYYLWINNGDGTFSFSQQTQYNNTQYDPKTGTLTALTAGEYGVVWVYRCMSIGCQTVHMILGNQSYDLNGAKAAQPVEVPQLFDTNTMLIGKVIILNGASTATEIDSAFETTFAASVTTSHGGLTGLTGGHSGTYDHLPIYQTDDVTEMLTYDKDTGLVDIPSLNNPQLRRLMSSSKLSGLTLSINADTSRFDIAAGVAEIVDNTTDIDNPTVTKVEYAGSTANTLTYLATNDVTYISIDASGTIYQSIATLTALELRDRVEIGVVTHPNKTTITSVDSRTVTSPTSISAGLSDISNALGIVNASGNIYSANGANLNIDKSSGISYGAGINSSNSLKSPNVTTDASGTALTFVYEWRDGAGGTQTYISNTIQPGYYDDNTTGSTTHPNGVVTSNKWTIMPIRYYPASGYTVIDAGQVLYNSAAEAEAGIKDSVEVYAVSSGSIRAWLIIRGAATDLSDPNDGYFVLADKFGESGTGVGTGLSTTTLQQAYDNSSTPEILTDTTRGALSVKRGSAADTDAVLEVLNGSDNVTVTVLGSGYTGIGTDSPNSPFHVFNDTENLLQLTRNTDTQDGTAAAGLLFGVRTLPDLQQKGAILFNRTDGWGRGDLVFAVDNAADNDNATLSDAVLTLQSGGNVNINNYTQLGSDAPAIKIKKLTGTTHASEGSGVAVAHGLTSTKILSVSALVEHTAGAFVPPEWGHSTDYSYSIDVDVTNININNHTANSANILSKPIVITIMYEE